MGDERKQELEHQWERNATRSKSPPPHILISSYPSSVDRLLKALKWCFLFSPKATCSWTKNTISEVTGAEQGATSAATLLTLGYGYCFPLGYNAPVNRGITMLGTSESFIIRKASLSPSGDHQWAMWECRSSSRINECYLKPTVEMWAQWPTKICPWNLHCTCTFSILVLDFINFIKHSLFLSYPFDPTKSRCKEGRKEAIKSGCHGLPAMWTEQWKYYQSEKKEDVFKD